MLLASVFSKTSEEVAVPPLPAVPPVLRPPAPAVASWVKVTRPPFVLPLTALLRSTLAPAPPSAPLLPIPPAPPRTVAVAVMFPVEDVAEAVALAPAPSPPLSPGS
jgi:hypothetical protein